MKYKRSTIAALVILGLLPLIITALLYSSLPQQIPTHWDINNTVTYSDKSEIWLIAGLSPLMTVLFIVIPLIDPKKKNYARFSGVYEIFCIVTMLFFLVIYGVVIVESLSPGIVNVGKFTSLMVGLLFIFLGNVMPKVKHNYSFGVKTPWALADPDVFNRSNRLAGFISFVGGIIITVSVFFLSEKAMFVLMMAFVAVFCIVPTVMSYIWFKNNQTDEDE